ncbi:MAG: hypothetical protein Q4D07_06585 [Selenomonadaceae bacterium]|nr:hypothetical protein [Selenomonadaceae bacterium]
MNKKIILGVLLCAAGLSALFDSGIGSAFSLFGKSVIDSPLKGVSFTRGGDMQGSFHAMSVRIIDEQTAMVCYEDASWHHEAIAVKEYLVPISVLDDIKTIFNSNKLVRCEKASASKFIVLDGATSSYSFSFENRHVHFSSTQDISRDSYQALRDISDCVAAACKNGQLLPGLLLEKDEQGNMPTRNAVVKDAVGIKVVGYKNKTLQISIGNGFDEEKTVSLRALITPSDDPEKILFLKDTKDTVKLPPRYSDDYRWTLEKRLEPGKYCLTLGGCTAEFEIR